MCRRKKQRENGNYTRLREGKHQRGLNRFSFLFVKYGTIILSNVPPRLRYSLVILSLCQPAALHFIYNAEYPRICQPLSPMRDVVTSYRFRLVTVKSRIDGRESSPVPRGRLALLSRSIRVYLFRLPALPCPRHWLPFIVTFYRRSEG